MVTFTGSTEVGKLMLRYAGESNLKRVSLECGGKSPHVVVADAHIDAAAEAIAWGVFYNAGENCKPGSRGVVQESRGQPPREGHRAGAGGRYRRGPLASATRRGGA